MNKKVFADEFDASDATKARRNEFGSCRFRFVSADLPCRENLIEVDGKEHMKFTILFQMIRPLTKAKKCYGIFIVVLN
jgi:hypothetical protein